MSQSLRGQWVLIPDRHILVCKGDPYHPESVQDVYLLAVPFLESLDDHKDYMHFGAKAAIPSIEEERDSSNNAAVVINTPLKPSEILLQQSPTRAQITYALQNKQNNASGKFIGSRSMSCGGSLDLNGVAMTTSKQQTPTLATPAVARTVQRLTSPLEKKFRSGTYVCHSVH